MFAILCKSGLDILRKLSYIMSMRRRHTYRLLSLPAFLVTSAQLFSQSSLLTEEQLHHSMVAPETRNATNIILDQLDNQAPQSLIDAHLGRADLSTAQKEAVLLRLTNRLRTHSPTTQAEQLLTQLSHYISQTQTTHHDNPQHTVPAFNIAASAQGALHEWAFKNTQNNIIALTELTKLTLKDITDLSATAKPQQTLNATRALPLETQGLLHKQLLTLAQQNNSGINQEATQSNLQASPLILQHLLAITANTMGDIATLEVLMPHLDTADALSVLQQNRQQSALTVEQRFNLLQKAISHPNDVVVSIVLQDLAKIVSVTNDRSLQTNVIDLLSNLLSHSQLRTSAAMALAQLGDMETLLRYLPDNTQAHQSLIEQRQLISTLREQTL